MSLKTGHRTAPVWLAVSLGASFALLFAFPRASLRSNPKFVQQTVSKAAEKNRGEVVCDAESCPHQVLFKLRHCDNLNLISLSNRITNLASQTGLTEQEIKISRLTTNCVFVAQSSNLSTSDLMALFTRFVVRDVETNRGLIQNDLANLVFDHVEPNFKVQLEVDTQARIGVSRLSPKRDSWWFDETPGIDAIKAWKQYGNGSRKIFIGVLDTGVYAIHDNLRKNVWKTNNAFSLQLKPGKISCKKNSYGYNVLATDPKQDCLPNDDSGHGTHVAGIVAAQDDSEGPLGTVSKSQLMTIKIASNDGGTCISHVLKALDFAIQAKTQLGINIRVLNNSYDVGVQCEELLTFLKEKIQETGDHGMLFIASAGQRTHVNPDDNDNDKIRHYPSGFYYLDNVISVTAIDQDGHLNQASGLSSNYGCLSVHLGAPGALIYSTDLPASGGFDSRSGTSMAAPFVSGAVALLLSVPGCSRLSPKQVKEEILQGAAFTPSLQGKTATDGRLDVYESIKKCAH